MARSKNTPAELTPGAPLDAEALNSAQNLMAAVQGEYSEERDLLNQLLGQAQMAGAFEEFSRTVRTSKLAFVKENKLYRAIAGKKTPNGSELSGTWNEFCSLLGISADKADMDIANLHAFGEEALESMSRMGIGYRELRQYRRLPEDQKLALIEVAKAGDKESFVDLAEEIIAKHAREKEALQKKVDETTANYQAQADVLSDKNTKIDKLAADLRKAKRHSAEADPETVGGEIRREATLFATEAEIAVRGNLANAIATLQVHGDSHGVDHNAFMAGLLVQIERAVHELRETYAIPSIIDGNLAPDYARGQ